MFIKVSELTLEQQCLVLPQCSGVPHHDLTDAATTYDSITTVREQDRYDVQSSNGVAQCAKRSPSVCLIDIETGRHVRNNQHPPVICNARVCTGSNIINVCTEQPIFRRDSHQTVQGDSQYLGPVVYVIDPAKVSKAVFLITTTMAGQLTHIHDAGKLPAIVGSATSTWSSVHW